MLFTREEMETVRERMREITRLLNLCTNADWDVAQNLEWELNALRNQIISNNNKKEK